MLFLLTRTCTCSPTSSLEHDAILQTIGVKQGCSLSPLLFNLTIQGLLLGLDQLNTGYTFADGSQIQYLAYADDLCIVSHDKDNIEKMIQRMEEFINWAQLQFNSSKCVALLAINSKSQKQVESYSPSLNN